MLVIGDETIVNWVRERMPEGVDTFGAARSIGVINSAGKLIAAAVFYNYRQTDIELAFAAETPRWATPAHIRGILHYPFFQLDCRRVTTLNDPENVRAIRFNVGIGFKHEGTLRDATEEGKDIEIYGLTRQDYMKGKYYG